MKAKALIKKQRELIELSGLEHFSLIEGRAKEPEVSLGCRLPQRLHTAVKVHCAENKITYQDFLIKACQEKLDEAK